MESNTAKEKRLILGLDEVGLKDLGLVGGKNSSLGEMIQQLNPKGINVPGGFAVTAYAYRYFIQKAGIEEKLRKILNNLEIEDVEKLQKAGKEARDEILYTEFPTELKKAIIQGYEKMCKRYGQDTDVAVRSSATAEDLPDASFAGQQETYLNVQGANAVIESVHRCFSSLFTNRAISYRQHANFDHFEVAISVGVQKMVRSDLATSGVMFSIDTETGFKDAAFITAAYGLGENVVQGAVNPDEYIVFKPTLAQGYRPILNKRLGSKEIKMVYDTSGSKLTKNVSVLKVDRERFCLSDEEILQLARWTIQVEEHYSNVRGVYTPMDIEWAKDGLSGELFIVQARPETVQSQKAANILSTYQLKETSEVITTGRSVGASIGQGKADVIQDPSQIHLFKAGQVLVTNRTDPDWEPIMKQAAAIVTNQGGRTCHAAIIARELGIPAIVGCTNATEAIKHGEEVTVSCAEGEDGYVYKGLLDFVVDKTPLSNLPRTRTQILMNVGNPQEVFSLANIPCDGVGLARSEFIIANDIKIHPLALLNFKQIRDPQVKEKIDLLTKNYTDKSKFFVDKLARGMAMIAGAFYPKPVIVRMSDLKSNEYANLIGGSQFEPKEENPMLGWRGASRYLDPNYRDAFALECEALKRVREDMGLINLIPMIPFCRTPEEGKKVLALMSECGLTQGVNGLQVYVMCELPNNVILAEDFCDVFDGFSIGSNDLTQLTLGIDRDSALVAHIFDERQPGVKLMIRMMIQAAKKKGRKVGICGQGPSDYPELAKFLVEQGIDSISLNPDSLLKTLLMVAEVEKSL